jgi:hypothetical protein
MLPIPQRPPAPVAQLYRLTIQFQGNTTDIYSMATSVDSAFQRYLDRMEGRKESSVGVELIHGSRV